MSESVPRVGIVGLGGMGTLHASNVVDHGGAVVAGTDVAAGPRASFAESFDAEPFEDAETMYDAVDLDAAIITTPNKFHEPAAVAALDRGIHVLCEKPLAHTLASAERIFEADRDSDAFCMVGFSYRFCGGVELFMAHRDTFGAIEHVEASYVRRRGIPGLGSWFTNEELSGGGALIDIGVHAIDFGLFLAGSPDVVEVSGVARSTFGTRADYADPDGWAANWDFDSGGFDVDDSATAFLRCDDGTTLSIEVAWATNREPSKTVRVRGEEAGARLEVGGDTLDLFGTDTAGIDHYDDRTLTGEYNPERHEAEVVRFLDAVRADQRPDWNTIEEGLEVQRIIDAVYRSSERGTAVDLR